MNKSVNILPGGAWENHEKPQSGVTLCSVIDVYRVFRGMSCLHLQVGTVGKQWAPCLVFLPSVLISPEWSVHFILLKKMYAFFIFHVHISTHTLLGLITLIRGRVRKQVTNGSITAKMDIIGFLCVSLGSSTVQLHDCLGGRCVCACS
jgi:hypothetical protein